MATVEAVVAVVRDAVGTAWRGPPQEQPQDAVLVAIEADPTLALMLPYLVGAVFEKGGIASHAAIMCREWGLPCAVGVADALALVDCGLTHVRIDHAAGVVRFEEPE